MENKGLLFIPDISGFTKFVSETEIEHSLLIIQELLEILIDANQAGLEISEIEGDAILFYKFGDPPNMEELYRQVENMFCAFHRNINAYNLRKYCQCKACRSVIGLTLKVITHYGEFTSYNVKNFSKLIGKDVIVAHQLLKNDIENHEYWLVTQNLADSKPQDLASRMEWRAGTKQTEAGTISFQYTWLGELKNKLPPEPVLQPELNNKARVISVSREYETDIITLFHLTGDFNYRSRWQEGVSRVDEVAHLLPRVGMRCCCFMNTGEVIPYTSNYYSYNDDRIEFSERNENNQSVIYYTLEKLSDNKTRFTLELYLTQNLAGSILFKLTKRNKVSLNFERSLLNLESLANSSA